MKPMQAQINFKDFIFIFIQTNAMFNENFHINFLPVVMYVFVALCGKINYF